MKHIIRSFAVVLSLALTLSSLPASALAIGSMAAVKTGFPQPVASVPVNLNPGGVLGETSAMPGDLFAAPLDAAPVVSVLPVTQPDTTLKREDSATPSDVIVAETLGAQIQDGVLPVEIKTATSVQSKTLRGRFRNVVVQSGGGKVNWDNAVERPGLAVTPATPDETRHADVFLKNFHSPNSPKLTIPDYSEYAIPNELHPEDARDILTQSPGGLYVSVGTERGFIGAALANKISHLLLIDYDPAVVSYNLINIALLQSAKNRSDYLHLRLKASFEDWQKAAAERNMPLESREVLRNADMYRRWQLIQAHNPLNRPQTNHIGSEPNERLFVNANYLDDDHLFDTLKSMADGGRIRAIELDLRDAAAIEALTKAIHSSQVKLGVLDLSNAWETGAAWKPDYIGKEAFRALLLAFSKTANSKSILMVTKNVFEGEWPWEWPYFGFLLKNFASGIEKVEALYHHFTDISEPNRLNRTSLFHGPFVRTLVWQFHRYFVNSADAYSFNRFNPPPNFPKNLVPLREYLPQNAATQVPKDSVVETQLGNPYYERHTSGHSLGHSL